MPVPRPKGQRPHRTAPVFASAWDARTVFLLIGPPVTVRFFWAFAGATEHQTAALIIRKPGLTEESTGWGGSREWR